MIHVYPPVYLHIVKINILTRTQALLNLQKVKVAIKANTAECFTLGRPTPLW